MDMDQYNDLMYNLLTIKRLTAYIIMVLAFNFLVFVINKNCKYDSTIILMNIMFILMGSAILISTLY